MPGPLKGYRIIDVCRAGPGRMATGILADYGADVVSIVEPGYAQRSAPGASPALRIALVTGVLVVAMFVGVLVALKRHASNPSESSMVIAMVVGGLVLAGLIAVVAVRRK